MAKDSKAKIRRNIIKSSQLYKSELAGKYYIYIYGNKYIEILFKTNNFSHLTGVVTSLSGKEFYKLANKNKLSEGQFHFSSNHPLDLAEKKTRKLDKLSQLTKNDVFIIEDMNSGSRIFKIGVCDLKITLGVVENRDEKTDTLIDNFLIPATFRVRGENDFDKNRNVFSVDFILMKDSVFKKYDKMCFGDIEKISLLPKNILNLIDKKMYT